jgi:hypothetical protein
MAIQCTHEPNEPVLTSRNPLFCSKKSRQISPIKSKSRQIPVKSREIVLREFCPGGRADLTQESSHSGNHARFSRINSRSNPVQPGPTASNPLAWSGAPGMLGRAPKIAARNSAKSKTLGQYQLYSQDRVPFPILFILSKISGTAWSNRVKPSQISRQMEACAARPSCAMGDQDP